MATIRELDTVALRHPRGQWAAGTTGAVLETLDEQAALVELVGRDGRTLDLLTVPINELELVAVAATPPGPGRLSS
jgi:hypothetical protein